MCRVRGYLCMRYISVCLRSLCGQTRFGSASGGRPVWTRAIPGSWCGRGRAWCWADGASGCVASLRRRATVSAGAAGRAAPPSIGHSRRSSTEWCRRAATTRCSSPRCRRHRAARRLGRRRYRRRGSARSTPASEPKQTNGSVREATGATDADVILLPSCPRQHSGRCTPPALALGSCFGFSKISFAFAWAPPMLQILYAKIPFNTFYPSLPPGHRRGREGIGESILVCYRQKKEQNNGNSRRKENSKRCGDCRET